MPLAQLVDHLGAGVVVQAVQGLHGQGADRLDLVVVEAGPPEDVGVDRQGRREVAAQGGGRHPRVDGLRPLAVRDAEVVQVGEQGAAVAAPRAPGDPLGQHRGGPAPALGLEHRPGRQQEGERGRLDPGHRLGHEDQAVGEDVVGDLGLGHGESSRGRGGWPPRERVGRGRAGPAQPSTALYRVLARRNPTSRYIMTADEFSAVTSKYARLSPAARNPSRARRIRALPSPRPR